MMRDLNREWEDCLVVMGEKTARKASVYRTAYSLIRLIHGSTPPFPAGFYRRLYLLFRLRESSRQLSCGQFFRRRPRGINALVDDAIKNVSKRAHGALQQGK